MRWVRAHSTRIARILIPAQLDSWLAVASEGTVTAYSGKCDFGQGMLTVQTQLVAEELCVPLRSVKIVQCDTALCPDQGTTSGSQSTPTNFNLQNLAQAAATAREALVGMAAKQFNEPADHLTVANGVITGKSGHRVTFAELIGNKRFNLLMNAAGKAPLVRSMDSAWQARSSLDRVALMTGQFEFVHNIRVPGMLHGRVVAPARSRGHCCRAWTKTLCEAFPALSRLSCVRISWAWSRRSNGRPFRPLGN